MSENNDVNSVHRRGFLGQATKAAAGSFLLSATNCRRLFAAANDRLTVGVVGCGSRGFNLIDELLRCADAQIVAVCDVDQMHHRDQPWGQGRQYGRDAARKHIQQRYAKEKSGRPASGVTTTSDYRDLCRRKDIDVIVVATPDHWHALCTLDALRHGKDVYCEKPLTHTFTEGQAVYREVAARDAVFQTGSQQRSDAKFVRAVELIRNGHLGQLHRIAVGLPPGYAEPQGEAIAKDPPSSLDYDFWCGPAPMLPYMRARHHRWWRGNRAYGGGVLMDWIGHHNDIAHWSLGLDRSGPTSVEAVDWKMPPTDVYDTPENYTIRCEYQNGVKGTISSQNPIGTRWEGERGWIYVRRGKLEASDPQWLKPSFDVGLKQVTHSPNHMRNFLDCVKSRNPCVAPAEAAHRSITPGHLGFVSHQLGRPLKWDAEQETVIGDEEANRLLSQNDYRSPWQLT